MTHEIRSHVNACPATGFGREVDSQLTARMVKGALTMEDMVENARASAVEREVKSGRILLLHKESDGPSLALQTKRPGKPGLLFFSKLTYQL